MPLVTSDVIKFNEYAPDQTPDVATQIAENVLPNYKGFAPVKTLTAETDALDGIALGFIAAIDSLGDVQLFAGDSAKLYLLSGTTFNDVSSSTYNTASGNWWDFAQYGDRVIATNGSDNVQTYVMRVDSEFSDMITSGETTLKAQTVSVLNEYIILGNTNDDTDGQRPLRVRWSKLGDPTNFDTTTGTGGFQDIGSDKATSVQRIVSGNTAAHIFLDREIWRMSYIGGQLVFSFNRVSDNIGTRAPRSVITIGGITYFLSESGFFSFDGQSLAPIGDGKIDESLAEILNYDAISLVTATVDPRLKVILWSVPVNGSETNNRIYAYNYARGTWSYIEQDVALLGIGVSLGYNLEQLHDVLGITNIDLSDTTLDSVIYQGGISQLTAFTSDNKLAFFSGANMAATVTSQELRLNGVGRARCDAVIPITDNASVSVALENRATKQAAISTTSTQTLNSRTGEANFTNDNRYHAVKLTTALGDEWSNMNGFQIRYEETANV